MRGCVHEHVCTSVCERHEEPARIVKVDEVEKRAKRPVQMTHGLHRQNKAKCFAAGVPL